MHFKFLCILLLFSLLNLNCSFVKVNSEGENGNINRLNKGREKGSEQIVFSDNCLFTTENSPAWVKSTWQKIYNNYRIANKKDFLFEQVNIKNKYTLLDISRWMDCPIISTDLNHDSKNDLIMILVNDSKELDQKYNILIINAPTGDNDVGIQYWLYQDTNLSKTYISKWSGGIIIANYNDNGSDSACYVNWSDKKLYSCDSKFVPQKYKN